MFLHNPSISELQLLEIPVLIEMLSQQTEEYLQLLKQEGYTARTSAAKEAVVNIQSVIESKINAAKRSLKKEDMISSLSKTDTQQTNKRSN